ncbi:hypothetical protein ACFL2H_08820 [Planctomycetota bacterium]
MIRFALILSLWLSQVAVADFVVRFDLDTTTAGIQQDIIAPIGLFTADIYGTTTDGDTLSSYSIGVAFDSAELAASNPRHTTPPGFDFPLFTPNIISASQIRGFSVGTNPSTPPITGTFLIGSIDFTPQTVSGVAGDQDIRGFITPGLDGAFDGAGDPVDIVIEPSSVSAVPEPGAWLYLAVPFAILAQRFCKTRRRSVPSPTKPTSD